ncbi:glycoside hydrolase family 3 protein [Saccharomonospora cyanea]|uniref:Exo-alpha-(1->6)-L-arabinopyranosidase n=1 Tax=Saccharomonospora cyanea NA-134 TaxID=882082 RepID=H5XMT4_9PSEU|nr:glycoside hydrolase family 3 protein [Saccharomonospora cyanea]EHR62059.1 beta-glucosidase-like glycosyl hydrolase [Saccharomonospora cyanea NA-134]
MRPHSPNPSTGSSSLSRRRVLAIAAGAAVTPVLASSLPAHASAAAAPTTASRALRFRDPSLPLAVRVEDLLSRLTLDEKIALLHQYQPAIPRLGVGRFKTGTEALHGVAWSTDFDDGGAVVTATSTVFPQSVGLASTWNPDLVRRVGEVVGVEARAFHSRRPELWGLQLWAPVVNLLRDPRWGRNEEGYSEDPHLTATIAIAYGHGIQGDDPDRLRAAPVLKHYLAYNNEIRRDTTSSMVPPRVKREYYEAAFRAALSADAATGVMSSYNLVNGRPASAHHDYDDVVRTWTERPLCNVTDAGGPNNLTGSQGYYATQAEADAAVLKCGLDSFTVDDTNAGPTVEAVRAALERGLLVESDVDKAVRNILSLRFRLGEFDPDGGPHSGIGEDVIDGPEHRAVNREAATQAVVLLKNADATLPLDAKRIRRAAVLGPLANTLYTDWYSGALPYRVTVLDGLSDRLGDAEVVHEEGADRIALRTADGRHVTATAEPGALRATVGSAAENTHFDVFDWGEGTVTLRAVAGGRYVSFGPDRTLVNDSEQPHSWFVQQQFSLVPHGDGHVLRYAGNETDDSWFGDRTYVVVGADGLLTVTAASAAEATVFTREVVRDGVQEARRAARDADVAVVVVGSMPFINGREDDDRTDLGLAPRQQELLEAVHGANPATVLVLNNSYPTTITWAQDHVPAIVWTTHAGAETGNAVADVLVGVANPSGRLPQTWYRSADDLPDILDYDLIKHRRTYQFFEGSPLYPFGHGLSYTSFAYGRPRVSAGVLRSDGEITVAVEVTNTGSRAGAEVVQLYTHQRRSRNPQPRSRLRGFRRVHLEPGETATVRIPLRAADLAHWDVTREKWVVESARHDILVGASAADIRGTSSVRVVGERIPPRDLHTERDAQNFDDYSGITLTDRSKTRGTSVQATEAGAWIRFRDVDLRRGVRGIEVRVANPAAASGRIEVRLDDPASGRVLGTVSVPSTGEKYTYTSVRADLDPARGRHDLVLVLDAPVILASLRLLR